jgi:hypothetical protein
MAKENKKTYPSRYSKDQFVTAAQYITELICEKKAQLAGGELPQHFWELPQWRTFFRQQIAIANKLVKVYPPKAIIRALQSYQANKIYSLNAPHLYPMIMAEEYKLPSNVKKTSETVNVDTLAKPRARMPKDTNLSKLRRLDE